MIQTIPRKSYSREYSTPSDYRHAMIVINYPAPQADIIRCNRRLTAKLTRHEISPFCGNCESLTQFCKHLVYVTYVIIKLDKISIIMLL